MGTLGCRYNELLKSIVVPGRRKYIMADRVEEEISRRLKPGSTDAKEKGPAMEVVKAGDDIALVPVQATSTVERKIFVPALTVLAIHLTSVLPLYLLNNLPRAVRMSAFNHLNKLS